MPGKAVASPRDPTPRRRGRNGLLLVRRHPLLALLMTGAHWVDGKDRSLCPPSGWAVVTSTGAVHLSPGRQAEPDEWAWVAAHCLLHLGFGHLAARHRAGWSAAAGVPRDAGFDPPWNLAACLAVNRFLSQLKVGRPPARVGEPTAFDHLVTTMGAEDSGAEHFRSCGMPPGLVGCGVGGSGGDLHWEGEPRRANWPDLLADGLAAAVAAAVDVAGGAGERLSSGGKPRTRWRLALNWFIASYPLLGALADAFTLVEDAELCRANQIRIAAISPSAAELYVNPLCGLGADECRFVVAHELMHAGLRHDTRGGGRDPWLWNIACDYVVNGWLIEMEVGELPDGALHDWSLTGKSAEEVYDQIAADRRRYRKLATLRGVALGDVLSQPLAGAGRPGWRRGPG